MNTTHKAAVGLGGALALAMAFAAPAQTSSSTSGMPMSGNAGTMQPGQGKMGYSHRMGAMVMGKHVMPATVSSVDTTTGMVEVQSAGHTLRVHFPPDAVASLKAGDKITLHLGFTKP